MKKIIPAIIRIMHLFTACATSPIPEEDDSSDIDKAKAIEDYIQNIDMLRWFVAAVTKSNRDHAIADHLKAIRIVPVGSTYKRKIKNDELLQGDYDRDSGLGSDAEAPILSL
jgi:uncharacterized glyoxalase superfamily metalloenzyme YdcJ